MTYTYFVSLSRTNYWSTYLGHSLVVTNYKINKETWEDFISKIERQEGKKVIILNIVLLEEKPE